MVSWGACWLIEIWLFFLAFSLKWAGRRWATEASRRLSQLRSGRRWNIKLWYSNISKLGCLFLLTSLVPFAPVSTSSLPISCATTPPVCSFTSISPQRFILGSLYFLINWLFLFHGHALILKFHIIWKIQYVGCVETVFYMKLERNEIQMGLLCMLQLIQVVGWLLLLRMQSDEIELCSFSF